MTGEASGTVVTVGSFDGVHRGHQAVVDEMVRRARARGLVSLLITFDPHPLVVVNPAAAPRLLTLRDEKAEVLAQTELDGVAVLAFTPELATLDPAAFVREVLRERHGMQELVLGHDHGFGRGRSGDVDVVRRLGEADGFAVAVVPAVRDLDGAPISSSLIRAAIAHGDLETAARGLGRPYSFTGRVEVGAGRGRTIGVPTANLRPDPHKLLPPDGVYAVKVTCRVGVYGGMMNQGARPTFGVTERALEIHLFDFAGDLYGEVVKVDWVRRLRAVQQFPSPEALVEQLERDRRAARDSLNL